MTLDDDATLPLRQTPPLALDAVAPWWRCLICAHAFGLLGSAPRLTLVAVTVQVGRHRLTIDTPDGAWCAGVCPDCAVEHAAALTQLEQEARRTDA